MREEGLVLLSAVLETSLSHVQTVQRSTWLLPALDRPHQILLGHGCCKHKNKRWNTRVLFHFLDVTSVNVWRLLIMSRLGKKDLLHFKASMVHAPRLPPEEQKRKTQWTTPPLKHRAVTKELIQSQSVKPGSSSARTDGASRPCGDVTMMMIAQTAATRRTVAKGNGRADEPQINFLFIVAEWRLEMHGLL